MHRDKKVGLALGILLIGIVGALFFRHDRQAETAVPELRDPNELDERIAEKPDRPYPADEETDPDDVNQADTEPSENSAKPEDPEAPQRERRGSLDGTSNDPAPEVDDTVWTDAPVSADVAPDPIGFGPQKTGTFARDPVPIPEHNRAWDVVETDESPPVPQPVPVERQPLPTAETRSPTGKPENAESDSAETGTRHGQTNSPNTYEVQRGDTLTGLAARFLGSARSYRELYRANRHLLDDPNDLRAGMVLRIPAQSRPSERTAQAEPPDEPPSQDAGKPESRLDGQPSTADGGAKPAPADRQKSRAWRFVPVRQSPFLPGPGKDRHEEESAQPGASLPATHRLSQRPPETFRQVSQSADRPTEYTVQPGDSLLEIALRFYGSRAAVQKLYAANRDRLRDPDHLPAGITLVLP